MALVVAKGSDIKTIAALKGKRIGVTTAGSLTDWLARQIATDQGWGPDGVNVLPLGAMETRISALGTGQISASVHDLTEAYEIERVGKGTILTLFGDIVKNFDTHVIFAHDNVIAQRPAGAAALPQGLVHDRRLHAQEQGRHDQDDRPGAASRRERRRQVVSGRHGDDVERRHRSPKPRSTSCASRSRISACTISRSTRKTCTPRASCR